MNRRTLLRRGLRTLIIILMIVSVAMGCSCDTKVSFGGQPTGTATVAAAFTPIPAPEKTSPDRGEPINLKEGCASQQGPGSVPMIVDPDAKYGIMCFGGEHQGDSIDMDAYCAKNLEGSKSDATNGWHCTNKDESIAVILTELCPSGWKLVEFDAEIKGYGYRCVDPSTRNPFEWLEYCMGTHPGMIYAVFTRPGDKPEEGDPLSWGCSSNP